MADKLDKDDWTGFVKKHKLELDDKALLKALTALTALDKAGEDKPDERAKVLSDVADEIKKMVPALTKRKKELGDKPFVLAKDKLYSLLDLAESGHKAALDAAAEAKRKASKGAGDDDEDDDSPAVLTTKMVPLIRQLKKGELRLPAMIGSISKTAAVLISKRSISSAKRKLLNEALDAAGGVKYAKGECYYEAGTLYFAMSEGKVGGLAKRVRAALLNQTGLRLKVKLRGEDGEDQDVEGEDEDAAEATAATGTPAAPGAQAADAATTGTASRPAPPGGPASAEQLAYVQRLRKVKDPLAQALKDQHPESTKLRALAGFASEKAQAKAYDAASKALDMVWQLLGGGASAADGGAAAPPQPAGGSATAAQPATGAAAAAEPVAATISIVRLSKARVEWDGVRAHATSELKRLKSLLQREYEGDAVEAAAVAVAFQRLDHAIAAMNEELGNGLDEVLNAVPGDRPRRASHARQVLKKFEGLATNDPIFSRIDGNEFAPDMKVAAPLRAKLKDIASALG